MTKTKYTKVELVRGFHNMIDDRPMQLTPAKIRAISRTQNDISKGRIKTIKGVNRRIVKHRLR